MALEAGFRLGPYEVVGLLGSGGMGEVYRARDPRLEREVAIKVLPEELADPKRLRRFEQEARAAGALNHPSVLAVYDVGTEDGAPYVVSELLEGHTLKVRLEGGALPVHKALDHALQIARGLAAAHDKGIVHRDLKPENVFITNDGRVKILDFGLAKLTRPAPLVQEGDQRTAAGATESGMVLGTVGFMSPEQVRGEEVDARSDIFSLGAVLFEMLSGARAFRRDSAVETMNAILKEDPPDLSGTGRGISPGVTRIVCRCLEKRPGDRFHSAHDLALALEAVSSGVSGPSDEGGRRSGVARAALRLQNIEGAHDPIEHAQRGWNRWRAAAIAAAAAVVLVSIAGWMLFRNTGRPERSVTETRAELAQLRAVALTTLPGQELYPSFSSDGKHVAFSWNGAKQDNFDIYVQMIGSGAPLQLTRDPKRDYNPVWSPDGRWIAFLRGDSQSLRSELRLIPPLGGPERKLATITVGEIITLPVLLSWCPDNACLVLSDSTGEGKPVALFALSLETGERRQLTRPEPPVLGDSQPAVSPDGQSLIFRRNISGGLTGELHVLALTRNLTPVGQPIRLTLPALDANHPVWTDSKDVVFSARERLWRVAVSGQQQPTRLPFVGEDGIMPAISRGNSGETAKLAYVRSFADTNIWRIDTPRLGAPSPSGPAIAISSTRQDGNPQLSPDGRRVVFVSNRSGDVEIWVADLDGSNAFQLTAMGAPATGTPRWSPDGESLTFNSNLEGHWDVYVVAASGGKPRRLTADPSNDSVPSFSRDGRSIYFNSNRTGEFQIWKVPTAGGPAVQVTHNGGYIAFESPDGAHVYYTQTLAAASPLWRLATSGGQPERLVDGIIWRNFVVLDRGVYYIDQASGATRLQFFDIASGRTTIVARGLGDVRYGLTASRDGRTVMYTRVDSTTDDLMLVENYR